MNDDIRYKAAEAVVALAHRTETAGRKDARSAKGKQWQPMPFAEGMAMHVDKLREAAAYYEIAESIDRAAAGFGYPRALLLESIGAWNEAIVAFRAVDGPYGLPARDGIARCERKRADTYDEGSEAAGGDEIDEEASDALLDTKLAQLQEKKARKRGEVNATGDDELRRQAGDTALAFVNLLLDRNYKGAHAMLHPWDAGMTPGELREEFEPLFEGEDFPESANVFDVQTDSPQLEPDDVAWVYVSISSENAEAVSLIVARAKKKLVVRSVEFGRP